MKKNTFPKILALLLALITVFPVVGLTAFAEETKIHEHKWDDGKVITEASCAAPGTKVYTCTECKQTKEEAIPALEHTRNTRVEGKTVAATCTEEGYTLYKCSVCGYNYRDELTPALGHNYSGADNICTRCGLQKDTGNKACKLCGKVHDKNFFDRLEGTWHLIVYTVTHLFDGFTDLVNSLKK